MSEIVGILEDKDIPDNVNWYDLVLTKEGKLLSKKWNYDEVISEGHYDIYDVTDDPYEYLDKQIEIEYGATLDHLFNIVSKEVDILNVIYRTSWIKPFIEHWNEVKKDYVPLPHEYHPDNVEYVELYWHYEMNDEYVGWNDMPQFHGIGWELKEDKWESWNKEEPVYKAGYRISWGIDFMPLNEILHLPIKLNEEFNIYKDTKEWTPGDPASQILFAAKKKYTLGNVIEGTFWELSFYGSPENKAAQKEHLDGIMDDLDLENHSVEELMEQGKIVEVDCKLFERTDKLFSKEDLNDGFINDGIGWEKKHD